MAHPKSAILTCPYHYNHTYKLQQYVLRFNISMYIPSIVNGIDPFSRLPRVLFNLLLFQSMMLLQQLKQMPVCGILPHHVEIISIEEETVESDDLPCGQGVVNTELFW